MSTMQTMSMPTVGATATTVERECETATYVPAFGYLRAWITVLVLGHHAMLAYHPYAPPVAKAMSATAPWWAAFPVIDTARWSGVAWFVGSNETFFMALMFMLSGLFVWDGLRRRGAGGYLRQRALRIGLPFAVAASVIAPLAYYPSYLQMGGAGGFAGFWNTWTHLGAWYSGPAWFLWVLLAFDLVAAGLYAVWPAAGSTIGRASGVLQRPVVAFVTLFVASACAYIALERVFGAMAWATFGPFSIQSSRVLHYFVYFMFGVGAGAVGFTGGVLEPGGPLAKRWLLWLNVAGLAFGLSAAATIVALSLKAVSLPLALLCDAVYAFASAALSFAALALFLRFARTRNVVFAELAPCAFGMYLVHYPIATILQYALLQAAMPGVAKALLVFAATVAISWGLVAMLRRVPGVARVI
jgi:peptidoglycan/LPS O-acetylase OafA/YrhL